MPYMQGCQTTSELEVFHKKEWGKILLSYWVPKLSHGVFSQCVMFNFIPFRGQVRYSV